MPSYKLTYQVTDSSGDNATTSVNIPVAGTLVQLTEFGRALAIFIDNVVGGILSKLTLTLPVDISGYISNVAEEDSDVEEVSGFEFSAVDGHRVSFNVPGLDPTSVIFGTDDLDQGDVFLAPLLNAMVNGIAVTGGTIQPCDVAESSIAATVFARKMFRASGRSS